MISPIRVALVEDHPELRASWKAILAGTAGLACLGDFGTVRSFLEAEPLLDLQVLLLDLELPGATGIDCLRKLRAKRRKYETLILTVHDDPDWIFPALHAGASGYLVKPIEPSVLVAAIRELHAGGSPMSPAIARRVLTHFRKDLSEAADLETLTPRERDVLEALAEGKTYREIADDLGTRRATVSTQLHSIYAKLHVTSATAAVARFLRHV